MTDMAKQLNELFEELGVKTIGIESGYMTVESLFSLRKTLNVTILDEPYLNEIILHQRCIKSADELAEIRALGADKLLRRHFTAGGIDLDALRPDLGGLFYRRRDIRAEAVNNNAYWKFHGSTVLKTYFLQGNDNK